MKRFWRPAALIGVVLLIYGWSLGNGFVTWDDGLLITENPIIRGLTFTNIKAAFTSYDPELYIPLTLLSFQINYLIHGLHPFGYHLGNMLLHIGNALLIFAITTKLSRSKTTGWMTAMLFAVHPLHVEAVAWASARKDVLVAFFFLWTVFLYLQSRTRGRVRLMYWLSVVTFLFALLSKISVLAWPILLLLLDWYRGEFGKGSFKRAAPFALLSAIFGVVALGGKIANTGFLWEKILIGCRAITLILEKLVWPSGLSVFYPFTKPISVLTPEIGLSAVVVIAITTFSVFLAWKKNVRLPLFAWGWFLLLLAPTMTNIAKGHNELLDVYITSDRYGYLPSIGLVFVAAFEVERWAQRMPKLIYSFFAIIVIFLSVLTVRQSLVWRDTVTLFGHVSHVQPSAYVAWSNIGSEHARLGNFSKALDAYGKALDIRDDATTYYNVGQIYYAQRKIAEAEVAYRKAFESSPLESDAALALAQILISQGKREEAVALLQRAKVANPSSESLQQALDEFE